MENKNKKQKCSLKEHNELDANCYCQKCDIYICNKCEKYHSYIFPNHNLITLDKEIKEYLQDFVKLKIIKINQIIFVETIMNYVVQIALQKLKVKEMDNIIIVMYVIMKILQMKKNII